MDADRDITPSRLLSSVELNADRRAQRFATARANGQRWLAECRDLGDAYDRDAGVYFKECPDDAAVDQIVTCFGDDNPFDRLLGIYDSHKPLMGQGGGISRSAWLSGQR